MWFKKKRKEIRTINYDNRITLPYPLDVDFPKWGEILSMESDGVEYVGKVLSVRRIVRKNSVELSAFAKINES